MGAVYKASQPAMNRMVGVKILHPKLANRKDLVSRFRREARAMSHLTHPNTVKVFLYGELDDGSLYIVMEFLEGKNLNQTVRAEGPFPIERALAVIIQVCGALEEAHRAGIVHRDLKPENIFLCQSGGLKDFPKVLDFGLAKVTEREMRPGSIILTQEGMVFGTPEFMSPEQAQGKTLTPASDQYSLAVILYEVLTGKLPFEAKSAMDFLVAPRHRQAHPALAARPRQDVPAAARSDHRARALEEDRRSLRLDGRARAPRCRPCSTARPSSLAARPRPAVASPCPIRAARSPPCPRLPMAPETDARRAHVQHRDARRGRRRVPASSAWGSPCW